MGKVISPESSPESGKRRRKETYVLGNAEDDDEVYDEEAENAELRTNMSHLPEETIIQIIRYRDTLNQFGGRYKIDFRPKCFMVGGVCPINSQRYPHEYERAMISLRFAIDQYNNLKALNLELHKVVRVNMQPCTATHYYITFEAKDKVSDQIDVYCTKVWDDNVGKIMFVEEFFKENDEGGAAHFGRSTKTNWKV